MAKNVGFIWSLIKLPATIVKYLVLPLPQNDNPVSNPKLTIPQSNYDLHLARIRQGAGGLQMRKKVKCLFENAKKG